MELINDKRIWVSQDVYELIINNPDSIFVEAKGQALLELKVIGGPRKYMEKLEAARNGKD